MQRHVLTSAAAHLTHWEALAAMRTGIISTSSAPDANPHLTAWEATKANATSPFNTHRQLFPSVRSTFSAWEPHSAREQPSRVAETNPTSTVWEQQHIIASTSSGGLERTAEKLTAAEHSTNWEMSLAARAFHVAEDPVEAGTLWETAAATARGGGESTAALQMMLARQKDKLAELTAIANRQHAVIQKLLAKFEMKELVDEAAELQISVKRRNDTASA